MDAEEFIEHHGIKGQKWGQRLYQYSDGSLTPLGRIRYGYGPKSASSSNSSKKSGSGNQNGSQQSSKQYVAEPKLDYSSKARYKPISEMSDQELNAYVNRLRLEQSYSQLMAQQNPQKQSAAKRFVASIMNDIAAPAIKNVGKQTTEYALKQAVNKLTGDQVFKNDGKKDDKKDDNNEKKND